MTREDIKSGYACRFTEHDADGCLGYSDDLGGYGYCEECENCPKASVNNRGGCFRPTDDNSGTFCI